MKLHIISILFLSLISTCFINAMDAPPSSGQPIDYDRLLPLLTAHDIEKFSAILDESESTETVPATPLCTIQEKPSQQSKTYVCKCNDSFNTLPELKLHILATHTNIRPYECDEPGCGHKDARSSNFIIHMAKLHSRRANTELSLEAQQRVSAAIAPWLPSTWKYICTECFGVFPSKLSLSNHYSNHFGKRAATKALKAAQLDSRKRKALACPEVITPINDAQNLIFK